MKLEKNKWHFETVWKWVEAEKQVQCEPGISCDYSTIGFLQMSKSIVFFKWELLDS